MWIHLSCADIYFKSGRSEPNQAKSSFSFEFRKFDQPRELSWVARIQQETESRARLNYIVKRITTLLGPTEQLAGQLRHGHSCRLRNDRTVCLQFHKRAEDALRLRSSDKIYLHRWFLWVLGGS